MFAIGLIMCALCYALVWTRHAALGVWCFVGGVLLLLGSHWPLDLLTAISLKLLIALGYAEMSATLLAMVWLGIGYVALAVLALAVVQGVLQVVQ